MIRMCRVSFPFQAEWGWGLSGCHLSFIIPLMVHALPNRTDQGVVQSPIRHGTHAVRLISDSPRSAWLLTGPISTGLAHTCRPIKHPMPSACYSPSPPLPFLSSSSLSLPSLPSTRLFLTLVSTARPKRILSKRSI